MDLGMDRVHQGEAQSVQGRSVTLFAEKVSSVGP